MHEETTLTHPDSWLKRMRQWGRRQRHLYYTTPLAIWTVGIVYASLAPPSRVPGLQIDYADKAGHLIAYTGFGILLLRGYFRATRPTVPAGIVLGVLAVGWGVYIELIQGMTQYRSMDPWDGLCNTIGVALGCVAWFVFKWRFDPHERHPHP